MKKYLLLFALLAAVPAFAQSATPTVTSTIAFVAPTQNTDGSAISGAVTYNVYAAAQGTTPVKVASGVTSDPTTYVVPITTIPYGTTECFALTTVNNGVESALSSPLACKTFTPPTPGAPTNVTVTIQGTPVATPQ